MPGRRRLMYRPPWRIELTVRDGIPRLVSDTGLADTLIATLVAAGAPMPAAIGLILTDDAEIAALNESAMGHPGPTDVLSFPLLAREAFPDHKGRTVGRADATHPRFVVPGRRTHLGDIVVSVERAMEQAEQGRGGQTGNVRWSPADELRLLVTHGVLHVCGWDHADPGEEAAMRVLEKELLAER